MELESGRLTLSWRAVRAPWWVPASGPRTWSWWGRPRGAWSRTRSARSWGRRAGRASCSAPAAAAPRRGAEPTSCMPTRKEGMLFVSLQPSANYCRSGRHLQHVWNKRAMTSLVINFCQIFQGTTPPHFWMHFWPNFPIRQHHPTSSEPNFEP